MQIRWRATSVWVLVAFLASCATAAFWTPAARALATDVGQQPGVTNGATVAPLPTWTPAPAEFGMTGAAMPAVPPTAPATFAAAPAGCAELTQNGGFEAGFAGWVPGPSTLRAAVVTAPILSGVRSAGMGVHPGVLSGENRNSYSSIRQTVTVPLGYARTILSFWTYTWAESATGRDRQQFVLLGPGNIVWAIPWRVLDNAQAWQQHIFEIIGVGGQTFDLYFGAVNDGKGGRTALFVDEVHLWGCAADAWPAATNQMQASGMTQPDTSALAPTLQVAPVPQVYPVETPPSLIPNEGLAGARGIETLTTPSAQWTVIAIGTVLEPLAGAPQAGGGIAATPAFETPAPLAEIPAGAAALLGTVVPELPSVTVSTTPQPANFLSNITARWPRNWPLVVVGIIVVAIIILLIVRARPDRIGTP